MPKQKEFDRTIIGVVLDQSGSMGAIKKQTIDGFNSWLLEQKQMEDDDTIVTVMLFDHTGNRGFSGHNLDYVTVQAPLAKVKPFTAKTYAPRGGTPLYDAMIDMMKVLSGQASSRDRVIMITITDGHENASYEPHSNVSDMIDERRATDRWTFMFLGANIDVREYSDRLHIPRGSTYAYAATGQGMMSNFARLSHDTVSTRSAMSASVENTSGNTDVTDIPETPVATPKSKSKSK